MVFKKLLIQETVNPVKTHKRFSIIILQADLLKANLSELLMRIISGMYFMAIDMF